MTTRTKTLGLMLLGLAVCGPAVSRAQDPPATASSSPGELEGLSRDLRTIEFDKGKLNEGRGRLDNLRREVDAAEAKFQQKDREVAQLKSKIDQEKKAILPIEAQLKQERAQIDVDAKIIDKRKAQHDKDGAVLDAALLQQKAKGDAIKRARSQIRTEADRLDYNYRAEKWNAEQDRIKTLFKPFEREGAQLTKDIAEFNRRAAEYNTRMAATTVRVRVLDSIVYNHDTGVGEVARFYRDYEIKLTQFNQVRAKYNAELAAVNAQIDAYNQRLGAVKAAQGKPDSHPRVVFDDNTPKVKPGDLTKPTHKNP